MVTTTISIKDFPKTQEIENYLIMHSEGIVKPFMGNQNFSLKVKVAEDSKRNKFRRPHFKCEIFLKLPGSKQIVKVLKSSFNFHDCVQGAGNALKEVVRRWHEHQIDKMKNKIPSKVSFAI